MIKSIFISFGLTVVLVLSFMAIFPTDTFAYDIVAKPCEGASDATVCQAGTGDPITGPNGIIMRAVNILSYIVGFVSVVMIILAGLQFVTANGNSESIAKARSTVIYALIGVVVVAFSQLLVRFIISSL